MKKKLLAVLLAATVAISGVIGFSACGEDTGNSGNGGNTEQGGNEKPSVIAVTEVKLNKSELTLDVGDGETLIATVSPDNATDKTVTWKSSDESVATVENGTVTALKKGTSTVTATAGSKSASCKVNVSGGTTINDFVIPDGGFNTNEEVEITFYHTLGGAFKNLLNDSVRTFNELYPNITVNHLQIGSYNDVCDKTVSELSEGKHPDIAYCFSDHVVDYNKYEAVQALDVFLPDSQYKDIKVTRKDGSEEFICLTEEQEDDFIKGFYDEGSSFGDNRTYMLPFSKSAEVMFYNKTFFEDNKLTVPETWDEIEEVCKKIKNIDPDSIPLGVDSESNLFITMCAQYGSSYTSATGENFLFDNATNRAFVERIKGWYDKGYITTSGIYGSYSSNLFQNQKAYMVIGSSAGAKNYIKKVDGENLYEIGIASIPQVNPANSKAIMQGPSVCIFKHDDPQKVIASWLLIKYLTTNVDFQAKFSITSGYMPVIKSVQDNEVYKGIILNSTDVTSLAMKVSLEQREAYFTPPAFFGSGKAREEAGRLMINVLKGEKTLDEAFKDAVESCELFIKPKNEK